MRAAQLNAALAAGADRLIPHERRLVRAYKRILAQAGREAARAFEAKVPQHLVAAAPTPVSTMMAVYPRPEEAQALILDGGEEPSILHVTLAFLGETDPLQAEGLAEVARNVASRHEPIAGTVGGVGAFGANGDKGAPSIITPDVVGLAELRHAVVGALADVGAEYSTDHGWTPHMTLGYQPEPTAPPADRIGKPLSFDTLTMARGDVRVDFPLGPEALTAASPGLCHRCGNYAVGVMLNVGPVCSACSYAALTAASWSAPHSDELIDVEALIEQMRTRSDPVRRAAIEELMSGPLKEAGLDFDVTNPLIAGVLDRSAAKVTLIGDTTRVNLMRIMQRSYEEGLSVPDTAKAIRAGMADAAGWRATLIARTEFATLQNGGALATVRLISDATGTGYKKVWLTAEGAEHPRHEEYDGLDGQTVGLDEPFDVGGYEAQFPGDPDLPPEESCNCRCSLSNEEADAGSSGGPVGEPADGVVPGEVAEEGAPALPALLGPAEGAVGAKPAGGYAESVRTRLSHAHSQVSRLRKKVEAGTASQHELTRFETFTRRQAEIQRYLNETTPDRELAELQSGTVGLQSKLDEGTATAADRLHLELLRKRQQEIADLAPETKIEELTQADLKRINEGGEVFADMSEVELNDLSAALYGAYEMDTSLTAWLIRDADGRVAAAMAWGQRAEGIDIGAIGAANADLKRALVERLQGIAETRKVTVSALTRDAADVEFYRGLGFRQAPGGTVRWTPQSLHEQFKPPGPRPAAAPGQVSNLPAWRQAVEAERGRFWIEPRAVEDEIQAGWSGEANEFARANGAPGPAFEEQEQALTKVGRAVGDEIDSRLAPVVRDLDIRLIRLHGQLDRARGFGTMGERLDLLAEIRAAEDERWLAARQITLDVLNEVRPMGPGTSPRQKWKFTSAGRTGKGKQLLDEAAPYFPRDWIERGAQYPIEVRAGVMRGCHWDLGAKSRIHLNDRDRSKVSSDTKGLPTAIHELGHHIEQADERVTALQWTFYQRRTRAGGLDGIQEPGVRYEQAERRRDQFIDEYMGKTYGNAATSNYEILSMGLEAVFTGSYTLDRDTRAFILGLLALL